MSGTSADGIDACLVKIDNTNPQDPASRGKNLKVKPLGCKTYKFPQKVQQKIIQISDPSYQNLDEVIRLNMVLGEYFAHAVFSVAKAFGYEINEIDLIGSHGQTVRHLPDWEKRYGKKVRATLQIGEPAVIASKTGKITVGDFRTSDIACGGQGAPLTPYIHHLLFGHKRVSRMVVNIGGIANVTVLPKQGQADDIFAFDSGPGNMIVDNLAKKIYRKNFDKDGKIASSGRVNFDLLNRLKKNRYFTKKPPKSCGRENFGEEFVSNILNWGRKFKLNPEDIIATASELSVWSIFDAYQKFVNPRIKLIQKQKISLHPPHPRLWRDFQPNPLPQGERGLHKFPPPLMGGGKGEGDYVNLFNSFVINQVLLSGGGVHNTYFLKRLKLLFDPIKIISVQELNVDPDFLEAISFAILANQTIEGKPISFKRTTGAKKLGVLGKICLP